MSSPGTVTWLEFGEALTPQTDSSAAVTVSSPPRPGPRPAPHSPVPVCPASPPPPSVPPPLVCISPSRLCFSSHLELCISPSFLSLSNPQTVENHPIYSQEPEGQGVPIGPGQHVTEVLVKGFPRRVPGASGEGQGRGGAIVVATVTIGDSQAGLQVTWRRRPGPADRGPTREL